MTKRDVKTHLLNHSEVKVKLLGEYLKRFLNIICNDGYTTKIHIYDLFSGEGLYENLGEGSPLVILKSLKQISFPESFKTPIDCHFNDIETAKVEKLKKVVSEKALHQPVFGAIEFSSIDYKEKVALLAQMIKGLQKQKAFVFIDPYEYKHISASQVKSLLEHKNAEVLLWLPTQFMYRFASNGTPEALKDFIEELVPYKEWKENDSVWKFITQLKDGFENYLGSQYFVDTFTIQKDASTVFCLYFFSSHIRGFEKMLEAKWEIDTENGKGWHYTGQQGLFSSEENKNILEEKLKFYLKENVRTNDEIYEFTLRSGFLKKHAHEILESLQNSNLLQVMEKNKPARKGAFYIDYHHYKNDKGKVSFKLM